MDLTTASPVEFDTALAARWSDLYSAQNSSAMAWSTVEHYAAEFLGRRSYREPDYTDAEVRDAIVQAREVAPDSEGMAKYHARDLIEAFDKYLATIKVVGEINEDIGRYNAVFEIRGRWTRAFLVNNSNGHVHSSMNCSTCFETTQYCWITEMSDHDEAEIVEKAGQRACTICYPTAPVEHLKRPTQFFTPDEKAKQVAKIEREAKRAAADEAKIVVEGLQGWTNEGRGKHIYKTTRGATNAIAGWLSYIAIYRGDHPTMGEWTNNIAQVLAVLEAKGIEFDLEKARAAAEKKARR